MAPTRGELDRRPGVLAEHLLVQAQEQLAARQAPHLQVAVRCRPGAAAGSGAARGLRPGASATAAASCCRDCSCTRLATTRLRQPPPPLPSGLRPPAPGQARRTLAALVFGWPLEGDEEGALGGQRRRHERRDLQARQLLPGGGIQHRHPITADHQQLLAVWGEDQVAGGAAAGVGMAEGRGGRVCRRWGRPPAGQQQAAEGRQRGSPHAGADEQARVVTAARRQQLTGRWPAGPPAAAR